MGAPDLLIADVSDINPDGHSRKPFGRVFCTKNKSLVFYAFDLDKPPGLRDVKTFRPGQNSLDKDRRSKWECHARSGPQNSPISRFFTWTQFLRSTGMQNFAVVAFLLFIQIIANE